MGVQERREREKENLREIILDAASRLFVQEGYANVSMRKIAKKIEYSPTTIYLYFKDKNDLLNQICEETFANLIKDWRKIENKADEPIVGLRRAMAAYVEFGLKYPNHYEVTFTNPIMDFLGEAEHHFEGSIGQQAFEHIASQVAKSMEAGQLKRDDVAKVSQIIWALGHGIVSLLNSHKDFPFLDKKVLIEGSIEMLFNGIAA
ncbi:MAG: TetR/AcrR family transcriptional regulator [Acidobacteriota bacterium]|nr:TetR/AcrR family transcriptional regulator [Acidobacteriota bacterium]